MRPSRWRGVASGFACIAVLGCLSFSSGMATAAVPSPERIAEAVAADNLAAERDQPLRLELKIQIGDRAAVATGILLTDPAGFARLELRGANGVVERHLLREGETWVTRNGEPLDEFRFFLPHETSSKNRCQPYLLLTSHPVRFQLM